MFIQLLGPRVRARLDSPGFSIECVHPVLEPKARKRIPSTSARNRVGALVGAALEVPHATEALHSLGEGVSLIVQVPDAPVQLAPCSEVASQGRPRQPETLRLLAERGGFLVPGIRHGSSSSKCAPFFVKQEMWLVTPDARQPA